MNRTELQYYVNRLQAIWRKYGHFLSDGKSEVRAIGREINDAYGFAGMQRVCDTVRESIGGTAARELEMAWDGIGMWLG